MDWICKTLWMFSYHFNRTNIYIYMTVNMACQKINVKNIYHYWGPSWPWSHGSWVYNYLCNQCLSPLMLWIQISIRARCTILCDKVCQWLAMGRWFSPGPLVSCTNKTETLLKMALNTIKQTNNISILDRIVVHLVGDPVDQHH
jgi:hypothetical protein